MKKTLKILLATMLCATMLITFAGAALSDFADAPAKESWKYAGLASAVENGIMNGANGKINPDDPLTRAELAAMMIRVLGAHEDKADIDHYIDVALDAWYADYIKSGVAVKIINGAGNKMMPNDPITREQAFAILARTFVLIADDHDDLHEFDDAHHVSDWAKDATAALIEKNIVQGGSENDIRPKANVTRAEYATMLDRLVGAYAKPGESYAGKTIKGSIVITSADVDLSGAIIEGTVIITDAVRDGEVKLDGVKVEGDLVMRSGTAVVSGSSEIKNVVYGNPIHKAEVRAENDVKVDKVVVTENAADVNNEISAEKVEIQASDANVSLGGETEYKEVEIKADNATVEVKEEVKVENATVEGTNSAVTGDGKVENATVSEGSKVETSGTNVTVKPSEPVTPDVPVTPDTPDTPDVPDVPVTPDTPDTPVKPSEPSKPSDSPNSSTVPTVTKLELNDAYIVTDSGKINAKVSNNVVEFDFTNVAPETVFETICINANKTVAVSQALGSFTTNVDADIATLVTAIAGDYAFIGSDATTFENLVTVVEDVAFLFDGKEELLGDVDVNIDDLETENTIYFYGKIGSDAYTLKIILP